MLCVNLLLLTCLSIVGLVSAAKPAYWVGTACSGDGVCGQANSQCYLDGCMCAIGFYYSEGSRTCLDSCTDLDTKGYYHTYPNATIKENIVYSSTEDDCLAICSKDPKCLSVEIRVDGTPCYFRYVAASVSNWEEVAGSYFFQKNCV
ncbi:uncharacterized protein [Littorina saxatilis]|uniref:Apple domain-containing protein n=1 Tax=Littorina saxatilis TaxID=31220 RepID=A0AAN9FXI4_9CAEN